MHGISNMVSKRLETSEQHWGHPMEGPVIFSCSFEHGIDHVTCTHPFIIIGTCVEDSFECLYTHYCKDEPEYQNYNEYVTNSWQSKYQRIHHNLKELYS